MPTINCLWQKSENFIWVRADAAFQSLTLRPSIKKNPDTFETCWIDMTMGIPHISQFRYKHQLLCRCRLHCLQRRASQAGLATLSRQWIWRKSVHHGHKGGWRDNPGLRFGQAVPGARLWRQNSTPWAGFSRVLPQPQAGFTLLFGGGGNTAGVLHLTTACHTLWTDQFCASN